MPTPYVSDAVLLQDVAHALGLGSAAGLAPHWADTVADANRMAVADLTAALLAKGYTPADVDSWDDRVAYNRRLGLLFALTLGNPLGNYPDTFLATLDARKDLAAAGLIRVAGVARAPAVGASEVGGIAFGRVDGFDAVVGALPPGVFG